MNADQVMKEVVESTKGWSSEDDSFWTVFELCSDIGIERPLRDWEIVTDVMSAWNNEESTNVLILKKYPYKSTLSLSVSIVQLFNHRETHHYRLFVELTRKAKALSTWS